MPLDHALQQRKRLTVLHHDHREVEERVRRMHEATGCEEARRLLRAAMRASRERFRQEERDVFPVLERNLGWTALAALGEAFEEAPKTRPRGARQAGRVR